MNDSFHQDSNAVTQSLGYSSGYIVAKYRYVNNQKDYYLQYFSSKYGSGISIFWAYANSPAYKILNKFKVNINSHSVPFYSKVEQILLYYFNIFRLKAKKSKLRN